MLYLLIGTTARVQAWSDLIPLSQWWLKDPRVVDGSDPITNIVPWRTVLGKLFIRAGAPLSLFVLELAVVTAVAWDGSFLPLFADHSPIAVGVLSLLAVEALAGLYVPR